mmetsp:Transcript_15195/g.26980  ORF Transcript_15195/g.26980 Transcript_15195/m.26980 type:complete len:402 (-) Transcript_15195:445-1650(-)
MVSNLIHVLADNVCVINDDKPSLRLGPQLPEAKGSVEQEKYDEHGSNHETKQERQERQETEDDEKEGKEKNEKDEAEEKGEKEKKTRKEMTPHLSFPSLATSFLSLPPTLIPTPSISMLPMLPIPEPLPLGSAFPSTILLPSPSPPWPVNYEPLEMTCGVAQAFHSVTGSVIGDTSLLSETAPDDIEKVWLRGDAAMKGLSGGSGNGERSGDGGNGGKSLGDVGSRSRKESGNEKGETGNKKDRNGNNEGKENIQGSSASKIRNKEIEETGENGGTRRNGVETYFESPRKEGSGMVGNKKNEGVKRNEGGGRWNKGMECRLNSKAGKEELRKAETKEEEEEIRKDAEIVTRDKGKDQTKDEELEEEERLNRRIEETAASNKLFFSKIKDELEVVEVSDIHF